MARTDLDVLVGLGDIAEIAGVSRAAVSNWRKRKKDFPAPRVTAPAGAMFDLHEVEEWLLANDKIDRPVPLQDILWRLADALRAEWDAEQVWQFVLSGLVYLIACERSDSVAAIAPEDCWSGVRAEPDERLLERLRSAANRLESSDRRLAGLLVDGFSQDPTPEPDMVRAVLNALEGTLAEDETSGIDFFHQAEARLYSYDRFAGAHSTPDALAYLLVRLLEPLGHIVVDPAVGLGGLLLMAALIPPEPPIHLYGFDINRDVLRYARAWMFIYDIDATLELRDALRPAAAGDQWTTLGASDGIAADSVLIDPPLNLSHWGDASAYDDTQWQWGVPPPSNANMAWPQVALGMLGTNGRAGVVLPPGAASSSGREGDIRQRLVDDGLVEAVVHLPPRLRRDTSLPVNIWLLRRTPVGSSHPVLLVDATTLGSPGRTRHDFDAEAIDRVVDLIRRWRDHREIDEDDASLAVPVLPTDLEGEAVLAPARYRSLALDVDVEVLRDKLAAMQSVLRVPVSLPVPAPWSIDLGGSPSLVRVPLRDLVQLVRGATQVRDYDEREVHDGVRILTAADIADPTRKARFVTQDEANNLAPVKHGDLVVVTAGQVGMTMTVGPDWEGAVLGRSCVAARVSDARITPGWLAAWAGSADFTAQLEARITGSAMPMVQVRDVGELLVPVPNRASQGQLLERLDQYDHAIKTAEATSRRLRRMREIEITLQIAEADREEWQP